MHVAIQLILPTRLLYQCVYILLSAGDNVDLGRYLMGRPEHYDVGRESLFLFPRPNCYDVCLKNSDCHRCTERSP